MLVDYAQQLVDWQTRSWSRGCYIFLLCDDSSYTIWAARFLHDILWDQNISIHSGLWLSNEAVSSMRQETSDQAIRMVPIDNLAPALPMQDGSYEYERL